MRAKIRNFITSAPPGQVPADAEPCRVLTYNMLAQSLVRRTQFPTNGNFIKWGQRFPALKEEIEAYNPDIGLFQEVDASKSRDWDAVLQNVGLTHELHTGPGKAHGLIVAYDDTRFTKVDQQVVHYDSHLDLPRQADTGNIGIVTVLKDSRHRYVIATTHLYWHPVADYERARQLIVLLQTVHSLKVKHAADVVILGGDLNSTPDSPAIQFLRDGCQCSPQALANLQASASTPELGRSPDGATMQYTPSLLAADAAQPAVSALAEAGSKLGDDLRTSLGLASSNEIVPLISAHATFDGRPGQEPVFTNWTDNFRATIDYIFVSPQVRISEELEAPTVESLGAEPSSLPRGRDGVGFPSDHIALCITMLT